MPCLHGGVAAAIIDHCGGFCAWTTLDDSNYLVSTVSLSLDYLTPAPAADMLCDAVVNHKSKTLIRTDITCWNKDRTVKLAVGHGTYNIYKVKVVWCVVVCGVALGGSPLLS